MPDPQRIDPVLVEKVDDAFTGLRGISEQRIVDVQSSGGSLHRLRIEAAIRSVLNELRLKEDRMITPGVLERTMVRLVSDWRPVEQGDAQ